MKNAFKGLGKVVIMFGCTIMQMVAAVFRFISLIFEIVTRVFSKISDVLCDISASIVTKLGDVKEETKNENV